ncbi:MAG: glycosyltransferase family 2 protein [Aggregatilineales bacterium]
MSVRPDLSIIIVSWNVSKLLADCLDSVGQCCHTPSLKSPRADGLTVEVIVVDSASSDGTAAMLLARYPQVELLAQSENVGFTIGNNIGLKAATGRMLMLLNPDTVVIGDALAQLVKYMDAHLDVGVVGPQTRNADGTIQSTRRRFPTLATAIFESTWLHPFAPRRVLDHFYVTDITDDAIADVDWVQGSALMVRREAYEQVGGLDERYVMFSEEVDWCKRIKSAGWRVVYVGTARIIHYGGQSTEQVTARKHIHFQQSKLRYFRKYHGPIAAMLLRVVLLASYGQQFVAESIKAAVGYKRAMRPERRERIKVYRQVIRALAGRGHVAGA